jgi:hypothetical protein
LPNGAHLESHDAVELLSSDTKLVPGRTQTTFGADESRIACFQWQLSYLDANALSHCPALTPRRLEIYRHLALPRLHALGFVASHNGSVHRPIAKQTKTVDVSPAPHSTKIRCARSEI